MIYITQFQKNAHFCEKNEKKVDIYKKSAFLIKLWKTMIRTANTIIA